MGFKILSPWVSRHKVQVNQAYGTFRGQLSKLSVEDVKQGDGSWASVLVAEGEFQVFADEKYEGVEPLSQKIVRVEYSRAPSTWAMPLSKVFRDLYLKAADDYEEVEQEVQDPDPLEEEMDLQLPAKRPRLDPVGASGMDVTE